MQSRATFYKRTQTALSRPTDFIRAGKLHELAPLSVLKIRERYLRENCRLWAELAVNATDELNEQVALTWLEEDGKRLIAVQDAIINLDALRSRTNDITDEMICRARETPIDSLVEFTRGKARAFCHNDNNPSAFHGTRTNNLVCPVCDRKFDAIQILIERDGMSFHDAVRALQ